MICRKRSVPTAAAMSIECTTSANSTVTCLYSAAASDGPIGDPQPWQKRAFSSGWVPQVEHTAIIGPPKELTDIEQRSRSCGRQYGNPDDDSPRFPDPRGSATQ